MYIPWKRYLLAFVVTVGLFIFAFLLSSQFSNKKIAELQDIQDKIALDILSTETRFALLETSSCQHVVTTEDFETALSDELNSLARRLKFMESQFGADSIDVLTIRKQYSLLQIKDYLLVRALADRCHQEVFSVLYFYANDCDECSRQSLVLDELRSEYPGIRIYWLDKDLNTSAMETLLSMFGIKKAPTLIVDGKKIEGATELEDLIELVPDWMMSKEEIEVMRAETLETEEEN